MNSDIKIGTLVSKMAPASDAVISAQPNQKSNANRDRYLLAGSAPLFAEPITKIVHPPLYLVPAAPELPAGVGVASGATLGAVLALGALDLLSFGTAGLVYYNETHGNVIDIFTYYGDLAFDLLCPDDNKPTAEPPSKFWIRHSKQTITEAMEAAFKARKISPQEKEEAWRHFRARQMMEMEGLSS